MIMTDDVKPFFHYIIPYILASTNAKNHKH